MLDLEKLKRRRELLGFSMLEIAGRARLSKMGYWKIESGHTSNITLDTLDRLAQALRVNPCYLLKSAE
jgi:transcriptional regulator with XRE-family HTH domain